MKTTLMFRQMTANPRRTTLAHIKDLSELTTGEAAVILPADSDEAHELPQRTANPRRTVLNQLPETPVAP